MPIVKTIKEQLQKSYRRAVAGAVVEVGGRLVDAGYWLLGVRDRDTPPTRLHFIGASEFKAAGYEFLRYFTELGGLHPDQDVLDIGCGIGRMAFPLLTYLKKGSYKGIDIVPVGIEWCQKHITPAHPNFEFQLADLKNERYNPNGKYAASEFVFPYATASFDFVFLTSVFTHLLEPDASHYLDEISRMLRPGGRILSTWFLLNDESRDLIDRGRSTQAFKFAADTGGKVRLQDSVIPEAAVGYDEGLVRQLHEHGGLAIKSIHPGSWCGRSEYLSYQDIVVAEKPRGG